MIFYEAPHKLQNTLKDLTDAFGPERRISLCRELTKLNEEVIRTTLGEAAEMLKENARGEYVIAVSGSEDRDEGAFFAGMTVREHVEYYISLGLDRMAAIKSAAKDRGVPKNEIYKEFAVRKDGE